MFHVITEVISELKKQLKQFDRFTGWLIDCQVERNPCTGEVEGFREVSIKDAGTNAKNSTSLRLQPPLFIPGLKLFNYFFVFFPSTPPIFYFPNDVTLLPFTPSYGAKKTDG